MCVCLCSDFGFALFLLFISWRSFYSHNIFIIYFKVGVLSGGALLQQEKLRENKRQLKGEREREREREREKVTCCWIFRTILCVICYNLIKKDRKSRLLMLIVGCNK